MAKEEDDDASLEAVEADINNLKKEVEHLEFQRMFNQEHDEANCFLEIQAGAGGTEAQDWASMLERMYIKFAERQSFKPEIVEETEGDVAGIKGCTIKITGDYAYGWLRTETGIHRLVRKSPFDSNARRQTSFSSLDVSPIIDDDDNEVEIDMKDVRVDTYHASGAGGQNVNKTSSAVRMTHFPTGIVVSSQTSRDQVHNRENCMRMLRAKLVELREREREEKMADIKGEMKKIEWGSQIRSYVFHPYSLVKDHRTGYETSNVDAVMDGELDGFITAYLQMQ